MNNDKKLRFIHITKCAGTSIESLINTWGRHDKVLKESLSKTFPSNVEWWHVPPKWAGTQHGTGKARTTTSVTAATPKPFWLQSVGTKLSDPYRPCVLVSVLEYRWLPAPAL